MMRKSVCRNAQRLKEMEQAPKYLMVRKHDFTRIAILIVLDADAIAIVVEQRPRQHLRSFLTREQVVQQWS